MPLCAWCSGGSSAWRRVKSSWRRASDVAAVAQSYRHTGGPTCPSCPWTCTVCFKRLWLSTALSGVRIYFNISVPGGDTDQPR